MALNMATAISASFWHYLECQPVAALWNFTITNGKCMPKKKLRIWIYTASCIQSSFLPVHMLTILIAIFITSDFAVAILVIFFIRRLNFPFRHKVAISALMGMGIIASAAAIPKMINVQYYADLIDITWNAADLIMWIVLEAFLGIIAASLPALKNAFQSGLRKSGIINCSNRGERKWNNNARPTSMEQS